MRQIQQISSRSKTSIFLLIMLLVTAGSILPAQADLSTTPPDFLQMWGSKGTGEGQFSNQDHVATDLNGNVYVSDVNNHRIQKFSKKGKFMMAFGQRGTSNGQFQSPRGVAVDADGNIYVADTSNHRVQKFDKSGNYVLKWGSLGTGNGQFNNPYGLTVDLRNGQVFVTDSSNNRVQKFDSVGTFVLAWGSYGEGPGLLSFPTDVVVDGDGKVYVAVAGNNSIAKYTSSGDFVTSWGSRAESSTADGHMYNVFAVEADAFGGVYAADGNYRIQKFTNTGTFITKWGSAGTGQGQFSPRGLAISRRGVITVSDSGNSRIQQFYDATLAVDPPDTIPPKITLKGEAFVSLTMGDTYQDAGATAADETDGDLTKNIETKNPVDMIKDGVYKITYNVSDDSDNKAEEVTRLVVVNPPVVEDPVFVRRQIGRIFLQVQSRGEAWYVNPVNQHRYYLGSPSAAFRTMRQLGLGITAKNIAKIPTSTESSVGDLSLRKRLAGKILIDVNSRGKAWYVHPTTMKRHYLGRPADAFRVMRELGTGITNVDLAKIGVNGT